MRPVLASAACLVVLGCAAEGAPVPVQETASRPAAAPEEKAWPLLVIVPLGEPSPELVEQIADSVEGRLKVSVRISDPIPHPKHAWYKPRKRWRAEVILDHLDALPLKDAWRVVGLTEQPISTTKGKRYDWGIAGLGSIGGKSCVLTAYLFRRFKKKQPAKYRRYMENLVLHEVGHTLGLDHCPLDRCIMADAKGNAIRAARKSINEFCPRCTRLLADHLKDASVKGRWSFAERAVLEGQD